LYSGEGRTPDWTPAYAGELKGPLRLGRPFFAVQTVEAPLDGPTHSFGVVGQRPLPCGQSRKNKIESIQWSRSPPHRQDVDSVRFIRFCHLNGDLRLRLSFPDQASKPGDLLPDYDSPPVTESSIGIQFDGLANYHSLDAWDFWSAIRSEFPTVEEAQPLDPVFETFGPSDGALRQLQFQVLAAPIQPRFLFISKDGSELVQLQHDRLFFNWRKRGDGATYPRFPHVIGRLRAQLGLLSEWAERNKLGEIVPTQCETLYINRIPLVDRDGNHCGLSHFFPWLEGLRGRTEDGNFTFRRRLNDEGGNPIARLSCDLRYGTDQSGRREAQLLLLVRGRPSSQSIDDCLELIEAEREVIVRTFTEITAQTAHRLWGRKS
jgi:uncharacterized protein (TIGR04255 family)